MALLAKHVVSWIDKSEFESVYNEIFSGDAVLQQHAAGRLAVWKCRVSEEKHMPPFIVCTMELLSVKLLEMKDSDELHLRLASAMALVRFVNLLTEDLERVENRERAYGLAKAKGNHHGGQHLYTADDKRTSLRKFVSMLGIPEWQLDLRHAATHYRQLPSRCQLERAVISALEYLQETCWKPQLHSIQLAASDDELARPADDDSETTIQTLLEAYTQEQIAQVKAVVNHRTKLRRRVDVLSKLEPLARHHSTVFLMSLVENDYFLFTEDILQSLGIDPHDLISVVDPLELPEILVRIWQPVLYLLNKLQLTPRLLDLLTSQLTESSSLRDRVLAGWTASILTAIDSSSCGTVAVDFYYIHPCRVIGRRLLRTVLYSPNQFTAALIQRIFTLCVPPLSLSSQHRLLKLVHCYTSPAVAVDSSVAESDDAIYEVGMLNEAARRLAADDDVTVDAVGSSVVAGTAAGGCWTLASDDADWSLWPLGSYLGQNIGFTTLELPAEIDDLAGCTSDDVEEEDEDISLSPLPYEDEMDMLVDLSDSVEESTGTGHALASTAEAGPGCRGDLLSRGQNDVESDLRRILSLGCT
jgi:hypothetical protein